MLEQMIDPGGEGAQQRQRGAAVGVEKPAHLRSGRLQLPHPVREAEDLAALHGLDADVQGLGSVLRPAKAGSAVRPPVQLLELARNPYDFWPLITEAHREWTAGSDALVDGAPLPDTLGLLREGFRRMKLELLLGRLAGDVAALPAALDEEKVTVPRQGGKSWIATPPGLVGLLDVVSTQRGWLQGHLLWVRPDLRGQGLVGGYFDAALRWAKERGLHGMHFTSTLSFWERRAPRYGFARGVTINQRIGPPAVGWYREV